MVNDWESAFETCPPYGEGKGAYGPEDTALLTEMERTLEKLLPWLEAEGVYLLNEYLEVYRRYARRAGMGRRSIKAPPLSCYPKPTAAKIRERMETRITTVGMMIMAVPSTFTVAR